MAKPAGMSWAEWIASQPVQYTNTWQTGIGNAAKELGFSGDIFSPEYRQAQAAFYAQPPQHDGGGGEIGDIPVSYNPELLSLLGNYRFNSQNVGRHQGVNISDAAGQNVGTFKTGDTGNSFDDFAYKAIPIGVAALAGAALGGFIPGAEIGAAGGGGASAGGGLIGAGEGASQLAAYTAANPLTAAEVVATTLPSGGLPGLGSGLLSAMPAIAVDPMQAINAYTAANPVTMPQLMAGVPELSGAMSAAPSVFNAAADSQAYNQAAGITGAEAAATATPPATVNMGGLGGTTGTAGGLSGLLQSGGQIAGDALGAVKDAASPAWQWLKDNPAMGRLLLGGATSLLSASGSNSSGAPEAASGPAVQWNSQLQKGLLAPVQQQSPPALQRPAGLLAQGNPGAGAWRFMGG